MGKEVSPCVMDSTLKSWIFGRAKKNPLSSVLLLTQAGHRRRRRTDADSFPTISMLNFPLLIRWRVVTITRPSSHSSVRMNSVVLETCNDG